MKGNNREELYKLSNQLIEVFVKDIFSKNKINTSEVKEKISAEQREKLKQTVEGFKVQVEDFVQNRTTIRTVTEKEPSQEDSISPLREKFLNNKKTEQEIVEIDEKEEDK